MEQVIEPTEYELAAITVKKKEMIELGMQYGLTDKRTIKCSQQLDELMNKFTNVKSVCYA